MALMMKNELNKLFLSIPLAQRKAMFGDFKRESLKRGMTMFDDAGRVKYINVALRPWVVTKEQRLFLWKTGLGIKSALGKLLTIYLREPSAREIIPLTIQEEEWLLGVFKKGCFAPLPLFDRLDCNVTFDDPDWEKSFCFLEPNSVGVGGVHYIPTASSLIRDCVLPCLKTHRDSFKENDDLRSLLLSEIASHARTIGRKRANIALIEDQEGLASGTDEYEHIAEYFKKKGYKAHVADPRALHIRKGEIYADDTPIDILYRDCELDELIEIEQGGSALHALRLAFERNQVISSFAGEFDHKSSFEAFTDSRYRKYFTMAEREIFRKYIPWTRLIWDRQTQGMNGERVSLIKYVRRNKDKLVIKPNREYGGKDVVLGRFVSRRVWDKAIEKALRHPATCVAQKVAGIKEDTFPILKEDGSLSFEKFYVVSGFAATRNGIAFLGRFSKEPIVNVSRKGGLIPVMLQG